VSGEPDEGKAARQGPGRLRSSLLWLETVLALLLARVLVFVVPVRFSSRMFGRFAKVEAASPEQRPAQLGRARVVARRVSRIADRLPWHSTCLVRAMAGQLLFVRRGIAGGYIRFGVKRGEAGLEAHAWLLLGAETLMGGEIAGQYTPLADLG